ncbi:MAG: glycosyltransferase, partial [Bowdeniella nasicola]|nr:glycosyltransferase [Bowdeniella nasicola]
PTDEVQVYLCDDGNRPEARRLADKWGIRYLAREDHTGAKAGNLNYAMAHSRGEIVVTMDADMVMKPHFLTHTIGHFVASDVAFVQVPQAFYNPDVFQHNLYAEEVMRNDQDFFMRFIEPQRDRHNATIYIGSGAAFRRSALESIGGFVDDVITEDMATGLLLQNAGWTSVYVNEVLATGLSPETYAEMLKQRIRWARGNVQVLKKYGPHKLTNLNFVQRAFLLDAVHHWFFGVYQLFYWLLPIVTIVGGIRLVEGNIALFLTLWAVQFAYSRYIYEAITQGRFKSVWTNIYEIAQGPQIAVAVLAELLFARTVKFQVTSKGKEVTRAHFAWDKAWPQLLLFAISTAAMTYAVVTSYHQGWQYLETIIIPFGWMAYNYICLFAAILTAIDQPRFRHRLANYNAPARLYSADGSAREVSVRGLHIQKVCWVMQRSQWEQLKTPDGAIEIAGFPAALDYTIERADEVEGSVFVFARLGAVEQQTFAHMMLLLNQLNTQRFQHRPQATRMGLYDATIGLIARRITVTDRITGASRARQLPVLSQPHH